MATLSQIKVGNITYDICDANTRNLYPQVNTLIETTTEKISDINSNLEKINLNKGSGLNFNKIAIPSRSGSCAKEATFGGYEITWNLPDKPAFGAFIIQGYFKFENPGSSIGTWASTIPSIQNRTSSSASWTNWDSEVHVTYTNGQQELMLENTWSSITGVSTGQQQRLACYQNNEKSIARNVACNGYVTILWSKANNDTKTFSESGSTTKTIKYN